VETSTSESLASNDNVLTNYIMCEEWYISKMGEHHRNLSRTTLQITIVHGQIGF